MQVPYLKEIKKLGYFIVGTDINKSAPGKKFTNKFYTVGYEDKQDLVEVGKKENFSEKDLVFTAASQFAHIGAAHFATYFGINYIPEATVEVCLDKMKFYKILNQNGVPSPKTHYCFSKQEIEKIVTKNRSKNYYIKSDYGKSPWYVYYVKNTKLPEINFKKDRYLRNGYIVQEEVIGRHIRVNSFCGKFIYFVHKSEKMFYCVDILEHSQPKIEKMLRELTKKLYLEDRFVKFDLILNKDSYYILDVGIDPPQRFKVLCNYLNGKFAKNYSLHCLGMKYKYPDVKDMISVKVLVSARKIKRLD